MINEPAKQNEEHVKTSFLDILLSIGVVLATVMSLFILYVAVQHVTTESPMQAKIDSLQLQINKLKTYQASDTVMSDSTSSESEVVGGIVPGGQDNTVAPDGGDDSSLGEALVVALGFLICFMVLSIAFSCGMITVGVILSAIVMTLIVVLLIPYLKRKCQRCRHRGWFGWVTKLICWLFVKFEKVFQVLTVILWVASAVLLVICGFTIVSALDCLPVVGFK